MRKLLTTLDEKPSSEEELKYYLPHLISTYQKLVLRRQRKLFLWMIFWLAGLTFAFGMDSNTVTKIPVLNITVDRFLAISILHSVGLFVGTLSLSDKYASLVCSSELKLIHRQCFNTEAPIWYLNPLSTIEVIESFKIPRLNSSNKPKELNNSRMVRTPLLFIFVVFVFLMFITLLTFNIFYWEQNSVFSNVIFVTTNLIFLGMSYVNYRVKESDIREMISTKLKY